MILKHSDEESQSTHLNHRIFSKASCTVYTLLVKISMPIYSHYYYTTTSLEALLSARPTCSKATKASFVCFTREEREQHQQVLRLLRKSAAVGLTLGRLLACANSDSKRREKVWETNICKKNNHLARSRFISILFLLENHFKKSHFATVWAKNQSEFGGKIQIF